MTHNTRETCRQLFNSLFYIYHGQMAVCSLQLSPYACNGPVTPKRWPYHRPCAVRLLKSMMQPATSGSIGWCNCPPTRHRTPSCVRRSHRRRCCCRWKPTLCHSQWVAAVGRRSVGPQRRAMCIVSRCSDDTCSPRAPRCCRRRCNGNGTTAGRRHTAPTSPCHLNTKQVVALLLLV